MLKPKIIIERITDPWIIQSRQAIKLSELTTSWLGKARQDSLENILRC